jgi:hypothetical protein
MGNIRILEWTSPAYGMKHEKIWEENARWWDAHMAEGDRWHLLLIGPAVEFMRAVQSGEQVRAEDSSTPQFAIWS